MPVVAGPGRSGSSRSPRSRSRTERTASGSRTGQDIGLCRTGPEQFETALMVESGSPKVMMLNQGKLPPALLRQVLAGAPPLPEEVQLGPALGEDAAVIEVEAGCLVVAADPITLTSEDVGWSAVVVNANDVAVMGVRPRWFLATVLLPVGTNDSSVRRLFAELHAAVADLEVALVGGHSEITGAVGQPIVSGVMLGIGSPDQIVRSSGAMSGDTVVQIGEAPI
jgi:hydrogenase expression/formation protein HypE